MWKHQLTKTAIDVKNNEAECYLFGKHDAVGPKNQ